MAVDAQKIKDRLRILFPKANLSKTRLDAIAAKLATKPADDADDAAIDEVINDYNDNGAMSIEDVAKLDDKLRSLEAKQPTPPVPPVTPPVDDDPLNQLLNEFKTLKEEITSIKTEKTKEAITQRFNSDPRIKDIPAFMRKGYVPENEDDFEANVEALTGEYKTFAEKNKLSAQGGDQPAGGKAGKVGDIKKLSPEEATAIVKQMNT